MKVCSAEHIKQFVNNELSTADQRTLELHLESCEQCRSSLDNTSAEAKWWEEASEFLADEEDELHPLSTITPVDDLDGCLNEKAHHRKDGVRHFVKLLDASDDPQMIGRFGGYEIVGVAGAGGMSFVLKGFDRALNRYVAIKVLAPNLASSEAARTRFAREAQAAAAVVHDNVIAIHCVSEHHDLPYLVMPYERGASLQTRLDKKGPLELKEILRIGMQAAAGLAAAHAQGLVHRDVKPANILLEENVERVKLTDFGLARAVDDASLTRTGLIAGTPQYMSPEQARGDVVDQRSDLFSLGSVIYAMCTGQPPFRASSSYGVLMRVANDAHLPIQELRPDIPDWLCQLVECLLAKNPEDRIQTAGQVANLLEQCLSHVHQPAVEIPALLCNEEESTLPYKNRWGHAIFAGCLAVVLLSVVVSGWQGFGTGTSGVASGSNSEQFGLTNGDDREAFEEVNSTEMLGVSGAEADTRDSSVPEVDWDSDPIESLREIEIEVLELEQQLLEPLLPHFPFEDLGEAK